jgi:hypothetical protein
MKIVISCPYDTDMLDNDMLHLGELLKRLQAHGKRSTVKVNSDGTIHLSTTENDDQAEAVLTAIGLMQTIYDLVEARSPRPTRLYPDRGEPT